MKKIFALLCGLFCLAALADETIPPAPPQYFNDYAGVVSAATAAQLNQRLAQFERDASCQIVVAVYPRMQSDSSIEDYTVRVAQSWHVGQKDKDNGAVLFVFTQDRKMFLQTGYGLEGALPDAICKRIIEDEIKPSFKAGNYDAGLTAGVNAILAAVKGEYKGTGHTVADHNLAGQPVLPLILAVIFIVVFLFLSLAYGRRGGTYSRTGWSGSNWNVTWGGGGGGWSGGGSSGGGGGGFSGGGGSFGGGGAGGSW